MTEYIEREAVVKYLLSRKEDFLDDYGKGWSTGIGAASGICSEFPAADVAPVARGRWELHKDGSGTCKRCHTKQKAVWDIDRWQNYCGHCGARMVESESK